MPAVHSFAGHLSRASLELLSPLGRLLGSLEAFLEPTGVLLAASWSLFGRSWGGLGVSWAPLGPSLGGSWSLLGPLGRLLGRLRGDQNVTQITCQKNINFQTHQRRIILPLGSPFCDPKSTKIGPKASPNLGRFSRAKKFLFKSLLGPSWADLGAFWRPSWGAKKRYGIGKRNI